MTMNLDHDELHRLLAKLGDSDIQEFRLEGQDFRLEIKRNIATTSSSISTSNAIQQSTSIEATQPAAPIIVESISESPSNPPPAVAASRPEYHEITAPMVGTFYRAPAPGEPVFVEVGSRITEGQTICILEAMKLMNELESEVNGEIIEILIENGTPVEFGQVLMRVKPL
ncbi:acetyl-CoA carboxylase biotin carboxyl carrier protein [Prochlorococcus marinus]|uniref:Biotin carboxyl carrier protein of acetyl-CoA carboxylase n=1 Tax=Prochlorococcus marinus (strain MIT 9211) TaxID=93059 RepID=A9B9I3_PROM4|nr:acetyl-CoA carboxylase biotin carboxyl carrier protein [Prochlorococcus marinus]ABX07958.1 Biotin / Lipoyl attachment:Acetyl-CoA biotin carboxyl carrier subunit [Prochlorococcus marinus str. MIT 9211]